MFKGDPEEGGVLKQAALLSARLLAVGLVGLSQVAAQYWLDSDQSVSRDEAVALLASLAWRGLAGFPLVPH